MLKMLSTCHKVKLYFVSDEISKQLLDSDAKVVIAQVSLVPQVRQTFAKIKKCIPIIAIKEQVGYYGI